jgi:hypothetical protein
MAYVNSDGEIREHHVINLEYIGNTIGQDIRSYLTYLPGLVGLLALPSTYVEDWVRDFYAIVWTAPDHNYIHYALAGTDYRVTTQHETLGLTASETKIHELCYSRFERPHHIHGSQLPPVDFVALAIDHLSHWARAVP